MRIMMMHAEEEPLASLQTKRKNSAVSICFNPSSAKYTLVQVVPGSLRLFSD